LTVSGGLVSNGDIQIRSAYLYVSASGDTNRGIAVIYNNQDGASYTNYNGGLQSWFGIGFKCTTDSVTRFMFNTRDGMLYITGSLSQNSDKRYKENINPIENSLEKINNITGYYYNMIDDTNKNRKMGLLAQDLNEVFPESISYNKDDDKYSVSYSMLIAPLINSIKELTEINKNQDKKILELQHKLEKQEELINIILNKCK
jgi:hypothetical protein